MSTDIEQAKRDLAPPRASVSSGSRDGRPTAAQTAGVRRQGLRLRVAALARRHPVSAFLGLVFVIAYPVMSLPILASHGVIPDGWMPQTAGVDAERIASVLGVLLGLLPAALWVTWATDGADGVRSLGRRMRRWQIGARWWVLVLAGLPALTLTLALLLGDTFTPVDIGPFVAGQLVGLLVNLLLINMWEETAWAGVVQTRLEHTHGLAKAALLTAVPFALFHMPLHFIGDFSIESLTGALVTLLIVCAIVRLMIGVFLRGTGGSILAVALLHTLFNRSNNDEGMVAALVEGDGRKLAGLISVLDPDRRGRDGRRDAAGARTRRSPPAGTSSPPICPSHPRQGPGMNTNSNTAHHPAGAGSSHDQARQIMEDVAVDRQDPRDVGRHRQPRPVAVRRRGRLRGPGRVVGPRPSTTSTRGSP